MLDSSNFELEGYMTFWMSLHNNVGVKMRKDYNKRSSKKESLNGFSSGNRPLNQMLHFRLDLSTMYDIWYLFQSTMQMGSRVQSLFFSWLVSKRFDHPISQPVMSIHVPHVPSVISISKGLSFKSDRHRFLPNPFSCVLRWTVWLVWLPETNQNNT